MARTDASAQTRVVGVILRCHILNLISDSPYINKNGVRLNVVLTLSPSATSVAARRRARRVGYTTGAGDDAGVSRG
jgi:hypothetical protein